ncbi:MAG: glycosyltransferase family 4 protein [Phreatobacter sp.]|nr:glycosyltransferase family 4 protein [Phreatobacter sp.]
MRAPVGGLFRHVIDLAAAQAARGHRVGIVADASTGGDRAAAVFEGLKPSLALGLARVPMSRELGSADWSAGRCVAQILGAKDIDVVHGHGSKGGAFARLAGGARLKVYTPHGGSLHYSRKTPVGFVYLTLERLLAARTDLFLFESLFGLNAFAAKVCKPRGTVRVVHNGVSEGEFSAVPLRQDAADLLFIGELRHLKGIDVLIDAMALLRGRGRALTATIVGDGPDAGLFRQKAVDVGLSDAVTFAGAMPAREAFARGRLLVVPSRAESLPYVVLEAGAAGLPVLASAVGGIGEIFGPDADRLVPPGSDWALAGAIAAALDDPEETLALAARLSERIHAGFSVDAMAEGVLAAYGEALALRRSA